MTSLQVIAGFLASLGFEIRYEPVLEAPSLPGIRVDRGAMVVDRERLVSAGDLLHEAGHLAVMSPRRRAAASGRFDSSPGEEMSAEAWSYAAALHLGLDPAVVFHEHGYRGGGASIVEGFARGGTLGVPGLCWLGLTSHKHGGAVVRDAVFPTMIAWLNASERELR